MPTTKHRVLTDSETSEKSWWVWCPACLDFHIFDKRWKMTGTEESLTFDGSMLVQGNRHGEDFVCHSFLRDGVWDFLGDCTHDMKSKKIPMVDLPDWFTSATDKEPDDGRL